MTDAVILPAAVELGRWYDVQAGRRSTDQRPGMVLLDLGTSRVLISESCLEFRTITATLSRQRPSIYRIMRAARATLTAHPVAALASALPIGAITAFIIGRFATDR